MLDQNYIYIGASDVTIYYNNHITVNLLSFTNTLLIILKIGLYLPSEEGNYSKVNSDISMNGTIYQEHFDKLLKRFYSLLIEFRHFVEIISV